MTIAQGKYTVSYPNTVWALILPPSKRLPKWLGWGAALLAGFQWKHDAYFGSYMLGSNDALYSTSATYLTGSRIIYAIQNGGAYYGDNGVYEAIAINPDGSNTTGFSNVPPTGANIVPDTMPSWVIDSVTYLQWLSTFYWIKVQDNFIGANERANYSANRIIFEYALNKWFNSTFRQPGGGNSDIYITTNFIVFDILAMGPGQAFGGMGPDNLFGGMAPSYVGTPQYDFTIHVKTSVYNGLLGGGSQNPQTDAIIRSFVDRINAAGMIYNIVLY